MWQIHQIISAYADGKSFKRSLCYWDQLVLYLLLCLNTCKSFCFYFVYLFLFAGLTASERKNLILLFLLFIGAAAFWAGFDQSAGSLNIFARDYTDLSVLGFVIPVGWLQFANPMFVVIFAPIFAGIWAYLARINLNPNLPIKFAIGLLFMALSFLVMIIAVDIALESSPVGMQWLVLTYLFQTWGELLYPQLVYQPFHAMDLKDIWVKCLVCGS